MIACPASRTRSPSTATFNTPPRADNWIAYHEILGLRTKDEKLVFYPTWKDGPFWEFFDLRKDPMEMNNLAVLPGSQTRVAAASAELRALAAHYLDQEAVDYIEKTAKDHPSEIPSHRAP